MRVMCAPPRCLLCTPRLLIFGILPPPPIIVCAPIIWLLLADRIPSLKAENNLRAIRKQSGRHFSKILAFVYHGENNEEFIRRVNYSSVE